MRSFGGVSHLRVVIFDFDGTLADTFSTVVSIVNSLAPRYGFHPLDIAAIASMRHLRAQDLLKVVRIPFWRIPSFLLEVKSVLGTQIEHVSPFPGIVPALESLHEKEYVLGILTSNRRETVELFLAHNAIILFDFVYSEKDLFGKARVLQNLMKQYQLSSEQVVYVGDETRDIEAAHHAGIRIVSVGWGFNSIRALEQAHPDILIHKPHELVSAVESLFSK